VLQDLVWFLPEEWTRLRYSLYLLGCVLFSLGVKLYIDADLGTDPLHAMIIGMVEPLDTPFVKIGFVESVITVTMLAVWTMWNRCFPPLMTFVTMALVGYLVDIWNLIRLEHLTAWLAPMPLMLAAVLIVAYASALLIMSGIGIRVMDLLAITFVRKLGLSFLCAKFLLELGFVLVALLTGGPIGPGTIGFLLVVGIFIAPMMWANNRYLCLPNHGLDWPAGKSCAVRAYQRVEETQVQSDGSGWKLTTSIAASVPVATARMASAAPSAVARTNRCAEARARNSRGVPAPTRSRITSPRL
jgi:uncharacterized membrane protein YczE